MPDQPTTHLVQECLRRLHAGDATARDDLVACACGRLRRLAEQMLRHSFRPLARWEDADDVLHNALLRLRRSLEAVTPESPLHFFRLSALQLRRELRDLARHHFGPEGAAAHHASGVAEPPDASAAEDAAPPDPAAAPDRGLELREIHELVDRLPEPERTTVDLLYYQELTQEEAAEALGVNVRTVQRHWQKARLLLRRLLADDASAG